MNLQDAMLNKLHEASIKAARDQSLLPQGLQPMKTQQGEDILQHLRHTSPTPRPRLQIRPMSSSLGQSILDKLNNR